MPDIIKDRSSVLGPGATERFVDVTGLNEMAQQVVLAGGGAGGALTDAQLRATPVPVSGGLTDAQLRAVAVPVSGTVAISQTTPGTTNKVVADVPTATPTLYNVTLTNALTEYSQAMPANCRRFTWQCRTAFDVLYAFVTGKVAGPTAPYMTLKAARAYDSGVINQGAAPSTLYLASATAGVVVEIEVWS